MLCNRDQNTAVLQANDTVIIDHIIVQIIQTFHRLTPCFAFIGRAGEHISVNYSRSVLHLFEVEQPDVPVLHPQKGNAHQIFGICRLLQDQMRVGPCLAFIRGNTTVQFRCAMVIPVFSDVSGIDKQNLSVLQTQKCPLTVSWIAFSGRKEQDLASDFFPDFHAFVPLFSKKSVFNKKGIS